MTHTFYAMLTVYSWISLIGKVLIFPTIQKPYFWHFSIQGFAATLKPEKFTGTHFKHWQTRTTLWLKTMNVFWVGGVSLTEMIAPEQEAFRKATTIFLGAGLPLMLAVSCMPWSSVLDQTHDIQCTAKELELLKCELPDKFVAGCIIAKLPPSWRNFATSLKHLRREFSVEDVIGHLSVEQNSRAKDSHVKGAQGSSSANVV